MALEGGGFDREREEVTVHHVCVESVSLFVP